VGETLTLRNVKKNTLFFDKRTTTNKEGKHCGTPDASMHWLHICYTMQANSTFAIHGNAEFFTCGMPKSDKG